MDADWFMIIAAAAVYLGFAIHAGIRMSPEEARRFLRIELIAAAILLPVLVPAADSIIESLPDLLGIPLAVVWVAAFGIVFYAIFLGFVLLFRGAQRRVGIGMLCTAGVPFSLLYIAKLLGS